MAIYTRAYGEITGPTQLSIKFVLLINLKLLAIANSFLLNIAEQEHFSANKYENVNIFIFISRENFMLSCVEHEKSFITSGPGFQKPCNDVCVIYVCKTGDDQFVPTSNSPLDYDKSALSLKLVYLCNVV